MSVIFCIKSKVLVFLMENYLDWKTKILRETRICIVFTLKVKVMQFL